MSGTPSSPGGPRGRRQVSLGRLDRMARALPETTVADHFGIDSYRVGGRIFVTVPDSSHVRVMLDEEEIRALAEQAPETFEPVWWGRRLAAVCVDLRRIGEAELQELVADAWLRKAPARLSRAWLSEHRPGDGPTSAGRGAAQGRRRT